MKRKKRWLIWALRVVLALSLLGIAAVGLQLIRQARHAAQLAALGVPDLCDPTHIREYAALMLCSGLGLISMAGLSWLHRENLNRTEGDPLR